jgi:hypothetical protein
MFGISKVNIIASLNLMLIFWMLSFQADILIRNKTEEGKGIPLFGQFIC